MRKEPGTTGGTGNHGAVQTVRSPVDTDIYDTYNKNLALDGSPRPKKDVILRMACERVVTRFLHEQGKASYDEVYVFVFFNHRHMVPYLDAALANLGHKGNGHTPGIFDFIQDGKRMYCPGGRL